MTQFSKPNLSLCFMKNSEPLYSEEEILQAFVEAVSRIGGAHSELSDREYFLLLLRAKLKKRNESR